MGGLAGVRTARRFAPRQASSPGFARYILGSVRRLLHLRDGLDRGRGGRRVLLLLRVGGRDVVIDLIQFFRYFGRLLCDGVDNSIIRWRVGRWERRL